MVAVSPRLEIMTVPTGQIASCVVDMHACCLLPIDTLWSVYFIHTPHSKKYKLNSPVYDNVCVQVLGIKSVYMYMLLFVYIHFSLFKLIA